MAARYWLLASAVLAIVVLTSGDDADEELVMFARQDYICRGIGSMWNPFWMIKSGLCNASCMMKGSDGGSCDSSGNCACTGGSATSAKPGSPPIPPPTSPLTPPPTAAPTPPPTSPPTPPPTAAPTSPPTVAPTNSSASQAT